jgi:hypothetical protein
MMHGQLPRPAGGRADHPGEFRARAFERAVVVVGLLGVAVDDRILVAAVDRGGQLATSSVNADLSTQARTSSASVTGRPARYSE